MRRNITGMIEHMRHRRFFLQGHNGEASIFCHGNLRVFDIYRAMLSRHT